MAYDQWRGFYNRRIGDVNDGWGTKLIPYLTQLKITCTIVFRYHHVQLKDSRKKNCNLFTANGYCKHDMCPVTIEIEVNNEPKTKDSPCIFKVTVIGNANHDSKKQTASRHLTGAAREEMGMLSIFSKKLVSDFLL